MIAAIDAMDLRRKVDHPAHILKGTTQHELISDLRTTIEHEPLAVIAGMIVEILAAFSEQSIAS